MKTAVVLSLLLALPCAHAVQLKEVASGLEEPVWATAPKGSSTYFYILEKPGVIKVMNRKTGTILAKPFLDIRDKIKVRMNEQGLLGMAFCPQFSKTGRFYLNYTDLNGSTQLARFRCNPSTPTTASADTQELIMTIRQDSRNHNGGWISFGPDGYLYVGMGDGGSANDPKNRAQDLNQWLGKLLRIDVSGSKGYRIPKGNPFATSKDIKPEIYAFGLRNPWRCSFDPLTKGLYIADVGQNKLEEINYVSASKLRGANFGWRLREGTIQTPKSRVGGAKQDSHIDPVHVYGRGSENNQGYSITGGFIYRGKIRSLYGHYLFADWINPRIWSFKLSKGKATQLTDWTDELKLQQHKITKISSFAKDPQGELYVIDFIRGKMFKIVN